MITLSEKDLTKILYEAFNDGVNFEANISSMTASEFTFSKVKEMFEHVECEHVEKPNSVLEHASKIMNGDEEKERQYGPYADSISHTAEIASAMLHKKLTPIEVNVVLIALKLSRITHGKKKDNFVDACAYIQGLYNITEDVK